MKGIDFAKPALITGLLLAVLLLSGCAAPIGADPVTTRRAYDRMQAHALRDGRPSDTTAALLHRFDLDDLAGRQPDKAVPLLHAKALATRERDLLFALAELSYVAAEDIRRSLESWDPRDARDYYLASAVYAWLFLFGDAEQPPPGFLDRRVREACDYYNFGLGLALTERRATNGCVRLLAGPRRLPVGAITLSLDLTHFPPGVESFEEFLIADRFLVRGLGVRNRQPGIGTPLVAVRKFDPEVGLRRCAPATLFLRLPLSLAEVDAGTGAGALELHSVFGDASVTIANTRVPLEADLTTHLAYVLNQPFVWDLGMRQFLAPTKAVRSQLMAFDTFHADRIPVVFVHGTFASPVTWAELGNTLTGDPVLRQRYQVWTFMYGSGNALPISAGELRDALSGVVNSLDPRGTNAFLRRMVIIGHSQGGLLTKLTATSTGDAVWRAISEMPLEELSMPEDQQERLRRLLFLEPLPFVGRVIFISTPHRGSYLSSSFARRLAARIMSLPGETARVTRDAISLAETDPAQRFLAGKLPTSLDSMSPKNPGLLALANLPVAPGIKANSIIPVGGEVRNEEDLHRGKDGVVAYESAHVDYVESELVVRGAHSCQNLPVTIEEVRRILYEHLKDAPSIRTAEDRTAP